jgi:uncharacterized protein (DUF58 family)
VNAPAVPRSDGDGRVQVSLAELIALRARVSRAPMAASVVRTASHGRQASRLHGRGMDYAESRAYQPGDDIRRIDWRLTARSGRMHSKLFEEEREGRLLILLDQNAGMRFGTQARFKSVQAARAVALATWYAVRAGDKVGLLGFGGSRQQVRAQGGPHGALTIVGALAAWDARRDADAPESLTSALQRAGRAAHGARRILLVSDGFACDDDTRGSLLGLARRAEILVLGVADAMELVAPPPGRYPLAHDGERFDVELRGDRAREAFVHVLGAGHRKLATLADGLGLRHRTIDTTVDPLDAISYLLGDGRHR